MKMSKYHVVQLASKISRTSGIIAILRHFVPLVYTLLISPSRQDSETKSYSPKTCPLPMYYGDYKSHLPLHFL